jgi:hypothetical protein
MGSHSLCETFQPLLWHGLCEKGPMKTSYFSATVLVIALCLAGTPSWADSSLENGTPGAQGTEGTNPTHQDQNVTGPNGQHSTNTNPADSPPLASKSSSTTTPSSQ